MNLKHGILTLVLLFVVGTNAFSFNGTPLTEVEKYKQFGLVWGLLKYHHSEVSKGKFNWDQQFIDRIDALDAVVSQHELNDFLLAFILSVKPSKNKPSSNLENLFTENYDYAWIEAYSTNQILYKQLTSLRDNTKIDDYYTSLGSLNNIPSFKNEQGFKDFDLTKKSHRLLNFFSFWNVVQYFYVNKYLMDEPWFDVLDHYIQVFSKSESAIAYELGVAKLITKLNDSHAYNLTLSIFKEVSKYKPAFTVKLVNDTLVVSNIFNTDLATKDDIRLGDLIVEIEGQTVNDRVKQSVGELISAGNSTHLKRWAYFSLLNDQDHLALKIMRDYQVTSRNIQLYTTFENKENISLKSYAPHGKWKLIDHNIGYLNLDSITKKELDLAFDAFSASAGLIIDLRNYPTNSIMQRLTNYLYPTRKRYIDVLTPIKNRPSLGVYNVFPFSTIVDPFKMGRKNANYYNKPVILLVNHRTQSYAEFFGMAIQASPNCITLGESTAGAVMNVAPFTLPDSTVVNITSLGAFYPDGTGVQRKGLKIDVPVKETTENFLEDQYLAQAIAWLKAR